MNVKTGLSEIKINTMLGRQRLKPAQQAIVSGEIRPTGEKLSASETCLLLAVTIQLRSRATVWEWLF